MSTAYETLNEYEPTLRAEAARRWLPDFCHYMDPNYESARHTRILCDHLMAVERGDINRLMISMPPRHGKTRHFSQFFPAWVMGRKPDSQIILASYGGELAEGNSRSVRNFLLDSQYPFRTRVSKDSSAVTRWSTEQGGILIATGVGGVMTGFGGTLICADDLFKSREEADSEIIREKTWQWWLEVVLTRLMPGGKIVLGATRWHEDDVHGRILNSSTANQWTVLDMPAFDEEGHALWPEWYDEASLLEKKEEIGTRAWNALYMQRPTAPEGGMFKRAWFQRRHTELDLEKVRFRQVVQTVDSSFKTGVNNDWSVIATWGTDGVDYYLIDLWRKKVEFPELVEAIRSEYSKERKGPQPRVILIEDTAAGQSVIQVLRRSSSLPVIPISVKESKEARAESVTPIFEAGKVSIPEHHPLRDEFVDEHCGFPAGRHDDCVDTTAMALRRLRAVYQGNLKAFLTRPRGIRIRD